MEMKMKKVVQVLLLTIAITATMVAATTGSGEVGNALLNILLNNNYNAVDAGKLVGDGLSCKGDYDLCNSDADCCQGYCVAGVISIFIKNCKWCPTPGYPCGLLDKCCPGYTCKYEHWYNVNGECVSV